MATATQETNFKFSLILIEKRSAVKYLSIKHNFPVLAGRHFTVTAAGPPTSAVPSAGVRRIVASRGARELVTVPLRDNRAVQPVWAFPCTYETL